MGMKGDEFALGFIAIAQVPGDSDARARNGGRTGEKRIRELAVRHHLSSTEPVVLVLAYFLIDHISRLLCTPAASRAMPARIGRGINMLHFVWIWIFFVLLLCSLAR